MWAVFRHAVSRMRGQILGWGISLAVLAGYLLSFYAFIADQGEQLMQLVASYPPELLAFFGDMTRILTPAGYLSTEFFSYMPIIVGFFAVLTGSGLLVGDEESGTLDLVLAHPVSRLAYFVGRWLGFVLANVAILALVWLGFVIGARWSNIDVSSGEFGLACLSLLALLLLFGCLALFLSMVVPARRVAAMVSGVALIGSFFLTSLARIDEGLRPYARFSPLDYYQGGDAIEGLNAGWLAGLLLAALAFSLLAAWRFQRRDIRVGGEGTWLVRLRSKSSAEG
jgi:ABC-2 type transport system permease protein